MSIKNKSIVASLAVATLVTNVAPVQHVLAENINKFSDSDRQSNETYEPYRDKKDNSQKSTYTNTEDTLEVSEKLLSMTEADKIRVVAKFNGEVKAENLKWSFGNKDISEWKTWDSDKKEYSKDPFITMENVVFKTSTDDNGDVKTTVTADVNFGLLYNTTDLSPRAIRVLYPDMLGNYDFQVENTTNEESYKSTMKLNAYDSYLTYDELKPEVDKIFENANKDIYLNYESIGKSSLGRDQHCVVVSKDKESVDKYLEMTEEMLESPAELQKKIKDGTLGDYKIPVLVNNTHADETPGIHAQIDFLKEITTKEVIKYKTLDENQNEIEVELNVSDLLDNVILVMSLTHNPDSAYNNRRPNANGFDLNRDTGYQTQVETEGLVNLINKWNPVTFVDLHGFVKSFLIEPCTPPHSPNYEFDLVAKNSLAQAHAMGRAAVTTSTKYTSYEIPLIDQPPTGGWDDASTSYTTSYAQHNGAMSHTIETPDLNQESNDLFVTTLYGMVNFVKENKDELFNDQLEFYRRGVNGEDNRAVDKYLVNSNGESIGRPRGENDNFFPEYYVLPVDKNLQKNTLEVENMVEYLLKNGVKVDQLQSDTKVNNIVYPKGSYVVNMHQAKRGFANEVLFDGMDTSDFPDMFAETTMNFPAIRGFNEYEIRVKDAFKGKLTQVDNLERTTTKVTGNAERYIIKNTNNDVIKAINELLKNNKEVYVLDKDIKGFEEGEYIVTSKDLKSIANKYNLEVVPVTEKLKVTKLTQPKVYVEGTYAKFVIKELGFNIVDKIEESSIVVDDSGLTDANNIKNGIDYLGIGKSSIQNVGTKLIDGLEVGTTGKSNEGLFKAEYIDDRATGGYDEEEYIYTAGGSWIETVPTGVKEVAKISTEENPFIAGWWDKSEAMKGKTMGVTTDIADTTVTLYANTITNKAHPQGGYRLIANAIYDSIDGNVIEVGPNNDITPEPTPDPEPTVNLTDIKGHWAENEIQKFVDRGYIDGYPDQTFKPNQGMTRAEFVKVFNKLFGLTKTSGVTFTDAGDGYWAAKEIDIAVTNGVAQGVGEGKFEPERLITREEAATMLSNYMKIDDKNHDKIKSYPDYNKVSEWALDGLEGSIEKGYIKGRQHDENTVTLSPKDMITRAEAVVMLGRTK